MTEFYEENAFDRSRYDALISRIRYDKGDAASYQNLLHFLWDYIREPDSLEDREGLLDEYVHWNRQLMSCCYTHIPHDTPYINLCRCYESVVLLMLGKPGEGLDTLREIGAGAFDTDGISPKTIMTSDGTIYEPGSRLFLLYNYAKYFRSRGRAAELAALEQEFSHAFTVYDDGEHDAHDAFYDRQMNEYEDVIFYPVYDRVYRRPGFGQEADFFLFINSEGYIPLNECL